MCGQERWDQAEGSSDDGREGLTQVPVGNIKLLEPETCQYAIFRPSPASVEPSYLIQSDQLILGLRQLSFILGRSGHLSVQFVDLVLTFLNIKPLIFALLYGLAYWGY